MNKFKLVSDFRPRGDQPGAIEKLTDGVKNGLEHQVLLGVTGSGKTYTVANVIENTQLPTLVISHNKTLAAQTYQELKEFFPNNSVSYFVSYYDYYQPEAYLPASDTYIAKEVQINPLIDRLRLQATADLFAQNKSIVVASVSCIYNIGQPEIWEKSTFEIKKGQKMDSFQLRESLVDVFYKKQEADFLPGTFRVRGERIDIFLAYTQDNILRVYFKDNRIEKITTSKLDEKQEKEHDSYSCYPAKHYIMSSDNLNEVFAKIREEKKRQVEAFEKQDKLLEANRIEKRVEYDLRLIKETGYVNGIENYSRYFDGREPGEAPYSLLDYFNYVHKDDFLVVVDESHVTVPQIRGMYRGDLARKDNLIQFGFRLPSSKDNRPLRFDEFLKRVSKALYVSATPKEWEIEKSGDRVVEQIIRPTGLLDPVIEVRSSKNQINDLLKKIKEKVSKKQRVLVITLTKRMAEDLASYLGDKKRAGIGVKSAYLHAEIDTLKRTDILEQLRRGDFDVLVGINLLREGLDLPEVGLVAIIDADKQGFLRSRTSLIQIMGRAARNVAGEVVLYADKTSEAMREAIDEVERRRKIQVKYNEEHDIEPETIRKQIRPRLISSDEVESDKTDIDASQLTPKARKEYIKKLEKEMREFARDLRFEEAAKMRDRIREIERIWA